MICAYATRYVAFAVGVTFLVNSICFPYTGLGTKYGGIFGVNAFGSGVALLGDGVESPINPVPTVTLLFMFVIEPDVFK